MRRKPTAEEIDRKKLLMEIDSEKWYLDSVINQYITAMAKRNGVVRKMENGKIMLEVRLDPYIGKITGLYERKWKRMIAAHKKKYGIE